MLRTAPALSRRGLTVVLAAFLTASPLAMTDATAPVTAAVHISAAATAAVPSSAAKIDQAGSVDQRAHPGTAHPAAVARVVRSLETPDLLPTAAVTAPAQIPVTAQPAVDLMVLVRSAASRAQVLTLAEQAGAAVRHRRDAQGALTLRVGVAAASRLATAVGALADTSVEVSGVQAYAAAPNDEFYAKYQSPAMGLVQAGPAWELTHGSADVLIAVVDTGVDITHPDLVGKVAGTYNAVTGGTDVTDAIGHGTFVASIAAAATNNAVGIAGAGFNTRLLAVKVAGANNLMYVSDEAEGIRWATAHGADIINISLGSATYSSYEAAAVAEAQAAGVLVVAAAGNDGARTNPVMYPAGYPGVVGVASVDATGVRSTFSEYNDLVTVAAPGETIAGAVPVAGSTLYPYVAGARPYRTSNGTSYAAPLVAGQAALLLAADPLATRAQLRAAIVNSASAMPGKQVGAGLVNFYAGLRLFIPSTTPTLTSPLAGALVTPGRVAVTVASTARAVRFALDGVANEALTPVLDGVATLTLTLSDTPEPHTVSAADCTLGGLCGNPSQESTFTTSTPPAVITSPAVGVVAGVFALSATVSTATAQWTVDGTALGSPVTAVLGSTATTWSTYGLANGEHTVSVAGCALSGSCQPATSVTVTVSNTAPAMLTPTVHQTLQGAVTLTAAAPGGGTRFLLDGQSVGFAGSAPHTVRLPTGTLAYGDHVVVAVSCNAGGTECAGPASAPRPFVIAPAHPVVTVTGSAAFSPNADGVRDTVPYTVTLVEPAQLSLAVLTQDSRALVATTSLGSLPAGTTSLSWSGKDLRGLVLAGGRYVLQVTSLSVLNGEQYSGTGSSTPVLLDLLAPTLTGLTASGSTFFPIKDGYLDTFAPLVTLGEAGTLTLTITTSTGALVKRLTAVRNAGRTSLVWDASSAAGRTVAAGRYQWQYVIVDAAGNSRRSSLSSVTVSSTRR